MGIVADYSHVIEMLSIYLSIFSQNNKVLFNFFCCQAFLRTFWLSKI